MIGAGKYDEACTAAREATGAALTVLIVLGGKNGNGFSVQATNPLALLKLPDVLEVIAKQIRADMERGQL